MEEHKLAVILTIMMTLVVTSQAGNLSVSLTYLLLIYLKRISGYDHRIVYNSRSYQEL
jgi:hypothetical protein